MVQDAVLMRNFTARITETASLSTGMVPSMSWNRDLNLVSSIKQVIEPDQSLGLHQRLYPCRSETAAQHWRVFLWQRLHRERVEVCGRCSCDQWCQQNAVSGDEGNIRLSQYIYYDQSDTGEALRCFCGRISNFTLPLSSSFIIHHCRHHYLHWCLHHSHRLHHRHCHFHCQWQLQCHCCFHFRWHCHFLTTDQVWSVKWAIRKVCTRTVSARQCLQRGGQWNEVL